MGSNMLSQEEIDALLKVSLDQDDQDASSEAPRLQESEKDALGEIGNISMGTAATTMSLLLNRRVQITIPRVSITTPQEISDTSPIPFIVVEVGYTEGLRGRNLLVMRTSDGAVIADLMMGRDGLKPQEIIDDFVLSALAEAMNQMMGSAATSLSSMFNRTIVISPPAARMIDLGHQPLDAHFSNDEFLIKIAFSMTVEDLIDSEIMLLLQVDFAKEMLELLLPDGEIANEVSLPLDRQDGAVVADPSEPKTQSFPTSAAATSAPTASPQTLTRRPATQPVTVQPVEFQPLPQVSASPQVSTGNLQLLLDVPLQLTVELGRTEKTVREVLDLVPGSIFELDRVAGEPVDIHVNGKLVAKGEVVVIDDNFGVRITDIISVIDRVSNLQ
ncbi:MAG TPA: flagellar motor switch phosphatase FliY [Firmicutes bacterium]|nr:flagellar motor switch phosphatase FliY [Bacillota bacterium]